MRLSPELLTGLVIVVAVVHSQAVKAEDFRMQTEVFQGREKVAQTLTLFVKGDLVYDFIQDDDQQTLQTTVFDWRRRRFILLDVKRQLKTEISTVQLMEVLDYLAQRIPQPDDSEFQVDVAANNKQLTLRGKKLAYEAVGSTPKEAIATHRYQLFADWYARLNATRNGNPPPFARIQLNAELARKGLIPAQITRTVHGNRKLVRSKHSTLWTLSNTDRTRIQKTGDQIAQFRSVTPEVFWKSEQLVKGKK